MGRGVLRIRKGWADVRKVLGLKLATLCRHKNSLNVFLWVSCVLILRIFSSLDSCARLINLG